LSWAGPVHVYLTLTSISSFLAFSTLGRVTFKTPLSKVASILSAFTTKLSLVSEISTEGGQSSVSILPTGLLPKKSSQSQSISLSFRNEIDSFPADLKVVKADFVPPLPFLGDFSTE